MKTFYNLLLAALMLVGTASFSQTYPPFGPGSRLIAMTFEGGLYNAGTIVSTDINGENLAVGHDFNGANGANPYGTMIQGKDSALYGMTSQGGTSNYPHGVIFRMDMNGEYSVLHEFEYATGEHAFGSIIQTADGLLAGLTYTGGSLSFGTIFTMNTNGSNYKVIHNFDWIEGGTLIGCTLMQSQDGTLFGMTTWGGSNVFGTVFKIQPDGTGFTLLRNLDGIPEGSLVQNSEQSLFGVMLEGGENRVGTIFKINPDGSDYTEIFDFSNYNGRFPMGALLIFNESLIGVTPAGGPYFQNGAMQGGGTLYKVNMDGSGHTILHSFIDSTGITPGAGVILFQNKLYGYTTSGGKFNGGVFYSYDLTTNTYARLTDLNETTGWHAQFGTLLLINKDAVQNAPALGNFFAVNSESDAVIKILNNGDHIDASDLNIRVDANTMTSSVEFVVDGKRHSKDNIAPFALFAETKGDYKKGNLKSGLHTIIATPFPEKNLKGLSGKSSTVTIIVDKGVVTSLTIFPNPVKNVGTIEVTGEPFSKISIQLTGASDKHTTVVYQGKLNKNGSYTHNFSADNRKRGVYILSATIADEAIRKRFIIE